MKSIDLGLYKLFVKKSVTSGGMALILILEIGVIGLRYRYQTFIFRFLMANSRLKSTTIDNKIYFFNIKFHLEAIKEKKQTP